MAQYKAEGIVLAAHNWGDADKMVTFLTKERGRVKAAAFGCRRPRSPLAGGMQAFNILDLQLVEGRRVDTVRQCAIRWHGKKIGSNLSAMAYGAFVAEIVMEFCPEHEPQPEIFALMQDILAAFENHNPRITALAAAYQLLEHTGLQLHYDHCVHCGKPIDGEAAFSIREGGALCSSCRQDDGTEYVYTTGLRELIIGLVKLDWKTEAKFKVQGRELLQAEKILLDYLYDLLGHPLKSLSFIKQLASI
jgi:DNA repair protein RecO (recombination protein O)